MTKPNVEQARVSRFRAGRFFLLTRKPRPFFLLLLLWGCGFSPLRGQVPRLVVVIVVDQMRSDYLERFRSQFGPGGFNLLWQEGSVFAACQYDYVATETAPGHAVLSTGSYPPQNGIVGNSWYDRGQRRAIAAVADPAYPLVGGSGESSEGASPWALESTTLGDELRLSNRGASHVIALSLKDRAAVFAGGKNPNAVFWFDRGAEGFVTSAYYLASLPSWVEQFNRNHRLETYLGKEWKPLRGDSFQRRLELAPGPQGRAQSWSDFAGTPFAAEMEFELARAAVEAYQLGEDPATDLLWISLSATDYLGHRVGPDSALVQDMLLHVDRQMEEFFRFLDRRVGLTNVVLGLSSDHGVAPLPEEAQAARLGGGRIDSQELIDRMNKALALQFGQADWIESYVFPWVYLNHEALGRRHLDREQVALAAGEAALEQAGVVGYYTARQLALISAEDPMQASYARAYYPGRAGDLALRYAPFFMEDFSGSGTTHGSPYSYDRQVPLILWGKPFRTGVFYTETSPADLAPTLAALLKINAPTSATGRILSEAFLSVKPAGKRDAAALPENVPHE